METEVQRMLKEHGLESYYEKYCKGTQEIQPSFVKQLSYLEFLVGVDLSTPCPVVLPPQSLKNLGESDVEIRPFSRVELENAFSFQEGGIKVKLSFFCTLHL